MALITFLNLESLFCFETLNGYIGLLLPTSQTSDDARLRGGSIIDPCESTVQAELISSDREVCL